MCRFGKGYTLQVKIRIPDGSHSQDDVTGNKKKLHSRSHSTLASGSVTQVPPGSNDPLATATKSFHNFIYDTFQDVTLIEEHQVRQKHMKVLSILSIASIGCYHLSAKF